MRMVPVGSQAMQAKGELSGTVSYKPQSKIQKPKAKSQKPKASGRKTTTERCVGRGLGQWNRAS